MNTQFSVLSSHGKLSVKWVAKGLLPGIILLLVCTKQSFAASTEYQPDWWPKAVKTGTNDSILVTDGQARRVVTRAAGELTAEFGKDGETPEIKKMLDDLDAYFDDTKRGTKASLRELKTAAHPIYEKLRAAGYFAGPVGSKTGFGPEDHFSPEDYQPSNLGDLRRIFRFGHTYSATGDDISDWAKVKHHLPESGNSSEKMPDAKVRDN